MGRHAHRQDTALFPVSGGPIYDHIAQDDEHRWPTFGDLALTATTTLGFLQFDPQERTPSGNVEYMRRALDDTYDALIVLPEFFLGSYSDHAWQIETESEYRNLLGPLIDHCYSRNVSVIGSLPVELDGGDQHNAVVAIENGSLTFRGGGKRNLFGAERQRLKRGLSSNSTIDVHNVISSVQICLDVIDPVVPHDAARSGANFLLGPASVSVDFLRTIHKARALENQIVSVFANRFGYDLDGVKYMGRSAIFFPDGTEVSAGTDKACLLTCKVDVSVVAALKSTFNLID